ncbi:MAG: IclR family transcriptional regulator [Pseudomonadota bacterium]
MTKAGESSIVTKCAKVMDILSHAPKPLAFSEIIEKTGFVKSSTHRILSVLQNEELVEYDKNNRSYSTGPRLRDWARSAWRRKDLQQIASNFMYALSEETGMNSALSILDGDAILYIRTVDVIQLRYASHTGDRAPLHNTAAGKVFLANMSERRQQELLSQLSFEKFTENTLQSSTALKAQLNQVREEGFAKSLGEELLHVTGIAAPIWDSEDKVIACLSLWTQTEHATREEVVSNVDQLKNTAQLISEKLS